MTKNNNYLLKWKDFDFNATKLLNNLRDDPDFCDVTFGCMDSSDKILQGHRAILSSVSSVFREMLSTIDKNNHVSLFMRGVKSCDLSSILDFLYLGEVNIVEENVASFLSVANDLKIEGLYNNSLSKNQTMLTLSMFDGHAKKGTVEKSPRKKRKHIKDVKKSVERNETQEYLTEKKSDISSIRSKKIRKTNGSDSNDVLISENWYSDDDSLAMDHYSKDCLKGIDGTNVDSKKDDEKELKLEESTLTKKEREYVPVDLNIFEPSQPKDCSITPKNGRKFQIQWYEKFSWLEYSISTQSAYCFACRVYGSQRTHNDGKDAFTLTGYSNWKKALEKGKGMNKHESSKEHNLAMISWGKEIQEQINDTRNLL